MPPLAPRFLAVAPGPDRALRARGGAITAQSARLRTEIAATRQETARILDGLAVTLELLAARHPNRAVRLRARSQNARALAAHIRQQLPASRRTP